METIEIGESGIAAARVGLDTDAIGSWSWGGNTRDLERAMSTIHSTIERGITLIHTAPVYGFGLSERIVGMMLSGPLRERVIIATQTGLQWRDGRVRRNSAPAHVRKELEESLRRLRTDRIDLYIVQWPDPLTPIVETAKTLAHLLLSHDTLCRGLLTGTIAATMQFQEDDLRHSDPKFQEPRLSQYASAAAALDRYARACHGLPLTALAVRWVLDRGNTIALWGACRPEHLDPLKTVVGRRLDDLAMRQIEKIIRHTVKNPIGPRFMPPPSRSKVAGGVGLQSALASGL